jgi:arylsulfatase A-like enzyme
MTRIYRKLLVVGLALLFIVLATSSCKNPKASDLNTQVRPNVIVIFTDDMNFEDIGALGGEVLTPTIDRLMNEGVQFTNFYDCSAVCSPSRYNMLTGRYASRCKALFNQFPASDPAFLRWNVDINKGDRTIAHVMKENGYFTGMVGKYHNLQNEQIQDQIPASADPNDPEIQSRIRANYDMLRKKVQEASGFDYLENVYVNNLHALALPKAMQHHNMEWITSGALDFIEQSGDKPFFLYFATTLPHKPAPLSSMQADPKITPSGILDVAPNVQPSREEVIERVKAAGMSENQAPYTWLDDAITVVIDKLEQQGILDNTIILFASDHGGNNAKMTCYEAGVRAPAFAYWQNHFQPGKVIEEITANIDFAPTIYDLCGIEPLKSEIIDGRSLLPLIMDEKTEWRESLLLEITYTKAVVTKDWKYLAARFPQTIEEQIATDKKNLYNQEGSLFSANNPDGQQKARYQADKTYPGYFDRDQLYQLSTDPNEQRNLVSEIEYAQQLVKMKEILKSTVQEFPHSFGEFNSK